MLIEIFIPSYERSEILNENLKILVPVAKKYNIPITIYDDSLIPSVNINDYSYSLIKYVKNKTRLGHDKNILQCIKSPNSEYIWILGDSTRLINYDLSEIYKLLDKGPDLLILNSSNRIDKIHNRTSLRDTNYVLLNLLWHVTLTGVTIFKADLLSKNIKLYKNFPQASIFLSILNKHNLYIEIIYDNYIDFHVNKKSYWSSNFFETYSNDWSNLVNGCKLLTNPKSISNLMRSHESNTGLYSFRSLLSQKISNGLFLKDYYKSLETLWFINRFAVFYTIVILIFPKNLLKIIRYLFKFKL